MKQWDLESLLITLGEEGMMLFSRGGRKPYHIPTVAREIYDVSGAGDTVIASLTAALVSGADVLEASIISNHAAGIVVGKLGTASTDCGRSSSLCQQRRTLMKAVFLDRDGTINFDPATFPTPRISPCFRGRSRAFLCFPARGSGFRHEQSVRGGARLFFGRRSCPRQPPHGGAAGRRRRETRRHPLLSAPARGWLCLPQTRHRAHRSGPFPQSRHRSFGVVFSWATRTSTSRRGKTRAAARFSSPVLWNRGWTRRGLHGARPSVGGALDSQGLRRRKRFFGQESLRAAAS
jgi:hypothetical protein